MKSEELEGLIREADAHFTTPSPPMNLPASVQNNLRHRQVRRRAAVAVVAMSTILGIALVLVKMDQEEVPPTVAGLQASSEAVLLAQLERENDRVTEYVNRLLALERLNKAQVALAALQPPLREDPSERAAFVVIYQADRMEKAGAYESAKRAYREVLRYLPETPSAAIARNRLDQLRKEDRS